MIDISNKELTKFQFKYDTDDSGCWEWTGATFSNGYGLHSVNGQPIGAHRIAAEISYGELVTGDVVMHLCDNKKCVNPLHLCVGSHADNMADMTKKGRQARGNRHCSVTHPEKLLRGDRHHSRLRPETLSRGEKNGNAKLTQPQVDKIRADFAAGTVSRAALARDNGVSASTVENIIKGKIWRTT